MTSPPRIAELLIGLFGERDTRADLRADLREEFEQQIRERGTRAARTWYRRQVARSLWPLIVRQVTRSRSGSAGGAGSTLGQDVHYAARSLVRAPAFTAVVVLTLALGIGANTAVFSLLHSLVLEPLSFQGGDRLVQVWREEAVPGRLLSNPPSNVVVTWRNEAEVLESFAAFLEDEFHLQGGHEPLAVPGIRATPELLTLIGAAPRLGRLLSPDDVQPGADLVVLLTEELWISQFGSDATVIGRSVILDELSVEVVGIVAAPARRVLESGFFGALTKGIILPLPEDWDGGWRDGGPRVIARLGPDQTVEDAETELQGIKSRVTPLRSNDTEWAPRLLTPRLALSRTLRTGLWVLMGAAGMVLLITCANTANLMLVRRIAREREFGVRLALGAGRLRLARLVAAEGLLLGGAGSILALLLTRWVVDWAKWMAGNTVPEIHAARVEPQVFVFAAVLGLGTTLAFSLFPLRHALRIGSSDVMSRDRRTRRWGVSGWRVHQSLVVAQVALAMVLALGTGLLSNSLGRLLAVDPGIDVKGLAAIGIDLPRARYGDAADRIAFFNEVVPRVEALPGIAAVGWARAVPPRIFGALGAIVPEGSEPPEEEQYEPHASNWVSPGYFRVLGAEILEGRSFEPADVSDDAPVAILGRSAADRYWPAGGAVGSRISLHSALGPSPLLTVVGVVPDVKAWWLGDQPDRLQIYLPVSDQMGRGGVLLFRTSGDPYRLFPLVGEQVRVVDAALPIRETFLVADAFRQTVGSRRFQALLLSAFGGVSVLLAVLGVYGVLALSVSRRTREIGVRLALGATRSNISGVVVGQGMKAVALGVGLGLGLSRFLSRFIADLLWDLESTDPTTFAAVTGFMVLVGLVASYLPTRRASVVDPVETLRLE
jgi:predicted permease